LNVFHAYWATAGSFEAEAWSAMIDFTTSGTRARAIPHSVAIPKLGTYLLANIDAPSRTFQSVSGMHQT
jgi:hypothetical protein